MMYNDNQTDELVAVVDLGSSRCVSLIAQRTDQGVNIVGFGDVATQGVRQATNTNLGLAANSIGASIQQAEQMCGRNVNQVMVSVSGKHIQSQNSQGMASIADPHNVVSEDDIDRAVAQARTIVLPANREVLNLVPRLFKLDDQEGIRDPINMIGMRMEVDIHMITASSSALRNLEQALQMMKLEKQDFAFAAYAASHVVLNPTEKEIGAVCIDIGSDTTSFCAFVDGALSLSGVVPIGGRYISQDINAYCSVGFDNAEKIKLSLSDEDLQKMVQKPNETLGEFNQRRKAADALNLTQFNPNAKPATVSKSALIKQVISARVKEIFSLVGEQLHAGGIHDKLGAGAVIVGGAAKTVGLPTVASQTLNLQVRLGQPTPFPGVIHHLDDPRFATALGLLSMASEYNDDEVPDEEQPARTAKKSGWLDNFFDHIGRGIKNVMP